MLHRQRGQSPKAKTNCTCLPTCLGLSPGQDPPFGIHLCGPPEHCVVAGGPVTPLHDERIRPYRPLPTFRPDTLVQHYLRPEEMAPFYKQASAACKRCMHACMHAHAQYLPMRLGFAPLRTMAPRPASSTSCTDFRTQTNTSLVPRW